MVNLIVWLIIGAAIGWVTSSLIGKREDLLINISVGIVGAFVAGIVLAPLLGIITIDRNNFSLPTMLVALAGAVILLTILSLFRYRRGFSL
jgi:uncharacterized membrane protein YeaQ/YmgE (transglycosylase-associated protein family)